MNLLHRVNDFKDVQNYQLKTDYPFFDIVAFQDQSIGLKGIQDHIMKINIADDIAENKKVTILALNDLLYIDPSSLFRNSKHKFDQIQESLDSNNSLSMKEFPKFCNTDLRFDPFEKSDESIIDLHSALFLSPANDFLNLFYEKIKSILPDIEIAMDPKKNSVENLFSSSEIIYKYFIETQSHQALSCFLLSLALIKAESFNGTRYWEIIEKHENDLFTAQMKDVENLLQLECPITMSILMKILSELDSIESSSDKLKLILTVFTYLPMNLDIDNLLNVIREILVKSQVLDVSYIDAFMSHLKLIHLSRRQLPAYNTKLNRKSRCLVENLLEDILNARLDPLSYAPALNGLVSSKRLLINDSACLDKSSYIGMVSDVSSSIGMSLVDGLNWFSGKNSAEEKFWNCDHLILAINGKISWSMLYKLDQILKEFNERLSALSSFKSGVFASARSSSQKPLKVSIYSDGFVNNLLNDLPLENIDFYSKFIK